MNRNQRKATNPDEDESEDMDTEDTDEGFTDVEHVEDNSDFKNDWCV